MNRPQIVIAYSDSEPTTVENSLAQLLKLELCQHQQIDGDVIEFYLFIDENGLALQAVTNPAPGPLRVEFSKLHKRIADALLNQNLLKACGVRKANRPSVLDATAGLGTDSFLLTAAGCCVEALEVNPIVYALLSDGIERYKQLGRQEQELISRLKIRNENFLNTKVGGERFQVVYLDPMFPAKSKTAQAKKDMAYVQNLIGKNSQSEKMFEVAKELAQERVVVKRAKSSPNITETQADITFKGSRSRFDVYLTNRRILLSTDS